MAASESQRQERNAAKRLGGTQNAGSGSGWIRKNDIRTKDTSWELKTTSKKSFSLRLDELLVAERNATVDGRVMIWGLEFQDRRWAPYVVLLESDFLEMCYQTIVE
jgi:hypothetical protein